MNEEILKSIEKKLDKIIVLLTIQSVQDKDDKIYSLKNLGLSSSEVAILVGMTDNGIRSSKGWKRK